VSLDYVIYTVHFIAFCLGSPFFPGHGVEWQTNDRGWPPPTWVHAVFRAVVVSRLTCITMRWADHGPLDIRYCANESRGPWADSLTPLTANVLARFCVEVDDVAPACLTCRNTMSCWERVTITCTITLSIMLITHSVNLLPPQSTTSQRYNPRHRTHDREQPAHEGLLGSVVILSHVCYIKIYTSPSLSTLSTFAPRHFYSWADYCNFIGILTDFTINIM